jgi:hypothetical protein
MLGIACSKDSWSRGARYVAIWRSISMGRGGIVTIMRKKQKEVAQGTLHVKTNRNPAL